MNANKVSRIFPNFFLVIKFFEIFCEKYRQNAICNQCKQSFTDFFPILFNFFFFFFLSFFCNQIYYEIFCKNLVKMKAVLQ